MCRITACGNIAYNMLIARFFNAVVSFPPISANCSTFLNIIRNKLMKTVRRHVSNNRHSYSAWAFPSYFCGNSNDYFTIGTTTSNFFSNASNIGFIYFDNTDGQDQDVPLLDAIYASRSMRYRNRQDQEHASVQVR